MSEQALRTKMNPKQIRDLPEALEKISELEDKVDSLSQELSELKKVVVTHEQLEERAKAEKEAYEKTRASSKAKGNVSFTKSEF
jgi:cell division septum initiation protein DivIVA